MPKCDFETVLKPAVGNIQRFCIKFWHLHPWLTREAVFDQAMETIKKKFKKRGDLVPIMKALVKEKKDAILKHKVLDLATITKTGTSTNEIVFEDNQTAQMVMINFLKSRSVKVDKFVPDALECMMPYINALKPGPEKTTFVDKFKNIVPFENEAYLDKKRKRESALQAKERKRLLKESEKQQQMDARKKILEETIKQSAEKATPEKETFAVEAGADELTTARRDNRTGTTPTATEIDVNDPYAEYKLKIIQTSIAAQDHEKGTTSRSSAMRLDRGAKLGIKKTILKLVSDEGVDGVHVQYTCPGRIWKKEMALRISCLGQVVQDMWFFDQDLVNQCMQGNDGEVTDDVARVMLATILHYSVSTPGDIEKLGVHANYYEKNFVHDLVNTKQLWLPKIFDNIDLKKLHALYALVCDDTEMRGLAKSDRKQSLYNGMENWPTEKSKMVKEIIELLGKLDDEMVGTDPIGKKQKPMDPFDTESLIWKADE